MKIVRTVLALFLLPVLLLACAQTRKQAQTSQAAEQSKLPRGTVVVKQLPAGVKGVELREGFLRLKDGYNFVKQPKHRFAVARMSDGRNVLSGGCGCTGGTCDPVLKGGIIVCQGSNCTGTCGLALTIAGVETKIITY
jgi:hypothetical protein